MKSLAIVVVLLVAVVSRLDAQSAELARVVASGFRFEVNDTAIVFHGLDTSDPDKLDKEGHWNREYFDAMKNWGANIVRFPVHPSAWRSRGKENYLLLLGKGIELAKQEGMYVIIDWHSIGNLRAEKFQNESYNTTLKETNDFWTTMSKRYGKNTTVAFFELFNEPTVSGNKFGSCTWEQWRKIMDDMITMIRSNGAQTVPLVAGFNWAYDLTPIGSHPLASQDIGYVSHPYPMKREKPWEEKWTRDWGFVKSNYPVFLTEVGFCGADDRGAHIPVMSDESYGDALTNYCKENGISYSVWVFDPQWAPMLIKDWTFAPTRQGIYFKKALKEK